jgi:plasmid stability protein
VSARNITFSLPADLVRQAKIYAAQHDTTINSLVRELLQEKLNHDVRVRAAAERLLAIAEGGPYFTMDPASIRREELHDRR